MAILRTGVKPSHVVVDATPLGRPRFWATVWTLYEGHGWAENTLILRLRHLDKLYDFSDERFGEHSLDDALGRKDAPAVHAIASGFYSNLTSKSNLNTTDVQCWSAISQFFHYFAKQWAISDSQWVAFQAAVARPGSLRPAKMGQVRYMRALPDIVLRELLTVVDPSSEFNPFRSSGVRLRNRLVVLLLLICGLRRGELLLLTLDSLEHDLDVETGEVIYWLKVTNCDDDENLEVSDPRSTRPSIKTIASHREVPIPEWLAYAIELYIAESRTSSGPHNFLFTAESGKPLSAETVGAIFKKLSLAISSESLQKFRKRSDKNFISPHDLRYTCACVRYVHYSGDGRERAMEKMRAFFGWKIGSTMPERYARAAIQDEVKKSIGVTFENLLSAYRAL